MKKSDNNIESPASKIFINVVSAIGLCVFAYSLLGATSKFNAEWLLLSLVTLLVVARTDIQIPKIPSTVTLDDTFIYISVLLYGVAPSVALAGINAIICSLHYPNKRRHRRDESFGLHFGNGRNEAFWRSFRDGIRPGPLASIRRSAGPDALRFELRARQCCERAQAQAESL
jgi:hypothetical protein